LVPVEEDLILKSVAQKVDGEDGADFLRTASEEMAELGVIMTKNGPSEVVPEEAA